MESFGDILRKLRKERNIPLRKVASYLDIEKILLSNIEKNQIKPVREQVVKLAKFYNVPESELLVAWLSDKIVYELEEEEIALKALQAAEEKVAYKIQLKIDRSNILKLIQKKLSQFSQISKAWIYGSFARGEDRPESDIDIVVKTGDDFSYFDLAEIQYELENELKRKIDIGFIDSFKPYVFEHIKADLKLIYER
jgi:predicted nucleotidyltransferase